MTYQESFDLLENGDYYNTDAWQTLKSAVEIATAHNSDYAKCADDKYHKELAAGQKPSTNTASREIALLKRWLQLVKDAEVKVNPLLLSETDAVIAQLQA